MHNYHHISSSVARNMTYNIVLEVAPIASSLLIGDHDMSYILHEPNPSVPNMLSSHCYAITKHYGDTPTLHVFLMMHITLILS